MSYLILPTVRWFHVASAHALDILLDRDCGAELVSPPRPVRRLQTHHIHRDVLLESGHAGVGNTLVTGTGAPVDQQVPGNDLKERFRLILENLGNLQNLGEYGAIMKEPSRKSTRHLRYLLDGVAPRHSIVRVAQLDNGRPRLATENGLLQDGLLMRRRACIRRGDELHVRRCTV